MLISCRLQLNKTAFTMLALRWDEELEMQTHSERVTIFGSQRRILGALRNYNFLTAMVALPLALAGPQTASAADALQSSVATATLYFNGNILTMEGPQPAYVEALIERDGKILFVGSLSDAKQLAPNAITRNLQGKTLLPGFIDGHGHVYLTGFFNSMANVMPAPDGPGQDYDALVRTTKEWMKSGTGQLFINTFGWVLANGYDHALMPEGLPPTADVLDRITTDYPVLMLHQSGHVASVNGKALEVAGFSRSTPDPQGGVIRRKPDGSPDGVIEESALSAVANLVLSKANATTDALSIARGQDMYIRNGYTTAEEARAFPNITSALERAARGGALKLDVISYPDIAANAKAMESADYRSDHSYLDHYRIGGVKISLDGSPQAKTAWLTHPYHVFPPHTEAGYKGYPAMPEERALALFDLAAKKGWQIICHANGDAAIDQCLDGVAHAQKGQTNNNHRSVIIHAQTMRNDQVARTKELGALPSFFAAHTFYWGDYHRESVLGSPRAERISPTRDAVDAGLTLTSHHDAPAILPNAMRVVDATVNRTTRTGKVLGAAQRLTPYEALKAITIWGAVQHFEETQKGSLLVGKRADFAVLSANPITVNPMMIKDIKVVATIKDGRAIYCAGGHTKFCKQK